MKRAGGVATGRAKGLGLVFTVVSLLATPGTLSAITFTFDPPPSDWGVPLPAVFSAGGVTLTADSDLDRMGHSDAFSSFFSNVSGGALVDAFRLTQVPGYPPETLRLQFSRSLASFRASFGVLVDFNVVEDPTPASLSLEAFWHGVPCGQALFTPVGGPAIYRGEILFTAPYSGRFDEIVLTAVTAPNAGGPEFILDNVVVFVPEPGVFATLAVGLSALLMRARGLTAPVVVNSEPGER